MAKRYYLKKRHVPSGEQAQRKIRLVMNEFKRGELKSSSGQTVTDRKQALAIALSEARRRGSW